MPCSDGSIPSDNPFCTTPGNLRCAVWAYGLRNPFTLAMQPGSGRILISEGGLILEGKRGRGAGTVLRNSAGELR